MENEVQGVEAGKNVMVVIQASDGSILNKELFWRRSQQKCVDGVTWERQEESRMTPGFLS